MKRTKHLCKITLVAILSALVLSSCVAPKQNTYYWGEYESIIYKMYAEAGSVEADIQIEKLNTDIAEANTYGKKIPPGIYAHLGFMYASIGSSDLAIDAFTQEKALFPESTKFIDGMINRAFKGNKS